MSFGHEIHQHPPIFVSNDASPEDMKHDIKMELEECFSVFVKQEIEPIGDETLVDVKDIHLKHEIKTEADIKHETEAFCDFQTSFVSEVEEKNDFLVKWMDNYNVKTEIEECTEENQIHVKHKIAESILQEEECMVNHIGGKTSSCKFSGICFKESKLSIGLPTEWKRLTCNICNNILPTSSLPKEVNSCNSCCNIAQERRDNVNTHTITSEKLSTNESNLSFNNKINVNNNMRKKVSEKHFTCSICNRSFSQKSHLKQHICSHMKDKPYTCSFCEKSFTHKCNLTHHERLHTNDKQYACTLCDKYFTQKSGLIYHERMHANEKPYKCNICLKSFAQKGILSRHERVHTNDKPYTCNICKKSFSQKVNLTQHELLHASEKQYMCNFCGISFSQKSGLTYHEQVHTTEIPYTCNLCQKTFIQKCNFIRHQRVHESYKLYSSNI